MYVYYTFISSNPFQTIQLTTYCNILQLQKANLIICNGSNGKTGYLLLWYYKFSELKVVVLAANLACLALIKYFNIVKIIVVIPTINESY